MYLTTIDEKENHNIQFQKGNCEFLACALYEAFGYGTKVLAQIHHESAEPLSDDKLLKMSYDEYGEYGDEYDFEDVDTVELIHCFSYFQKGSKTYYVDSHGITTTPNDILKNFNASMKEVNEGKYILLDFKNPEEIKQYFWSTYHDWKGDDDFEKETEEYRVKPSREFVEKYKEKLSWPETKKKDKDIKPKERDER